MPLRKPQFGIDQITLLGIDPLAMFSDHFETSAFVAAPPDIVFAYADDPARLSSHMSESLWMMGGGRMEIGLDAGRGQSVGSRIRLSGRVFGLELSLEEIVIEQFLRSVKFGRRPARRSFC